MLAWPIDTARASGVFDRIVVSTDDVRLADLARTEGVEVPFQRDADLSDDHAPTKAVITDAIHRLALPPDCIVTCLYPTAAFMRAGDLIAARERIEAGAGMVLTLGSFPAPVERAYRKVDYGFAPRDRTKMPHRSQDLEPAYYDAGQFYMARTSRWLNKDLEIWDDADAVLLPRSRCIDIDTPDDWDLAEALFERLNR